MIFGMIPLQQMAPLDIIKQPVDWMRIRMGEKKCAADRRLYLPGSQAERGFHDRDVTNFLTRGAGFQGC